MKNTKPGESLHSARTRANIEQQLIDGIREEQQAKECLADAALQFAKQVRERSMAVANWGDGQGGFAIETVRAALIAAGVYRLSPAGAKDARKKIQPNVRTKVFERDAYRCVACGTHLSLTIDHIKPVSLGGGDEISNLQTMCLPCNSSKGIGDSPRVAA